jgi:hypothetical protein
MLRYFFDEHVIEAIAEQLVARGVDVLTGHKQQGWRTGAFTMTSDCSGGPRIEFGGKPP